VDICVMPIYKPRYDCRNMFHWSYQVAYRRPDSSYPTYQPPDGGWIATWDFDLVESHRFHYDSAEADAHHAGKGRWLYVPASADPEPCSGGDWSIYRCDRCDRNIKPFSDGGGDLVCSWCEAAGRVILDDDQLERLEKAREFARRMGLSAQLERQLTFLGNRRCWGERAQTVLGYDFAPHSFSFAVYQLPGAGRERRLGLYGGLIYQGPGQPADGSFPSLTVSLTGDTGWFCHT
jgi:hypothetical protein